jgi:hypothetical protein
VGHFASVSDGVVPSIKVSLVFPDLSNVVLEVGSMYKVYVSV